MKVFTYDTTLRDGTQREGLSLSVEDKLRIVERLDGYGIDYIEGGFPFSNPKDQQFFKEVAGLKLKHAKIVAFGSTRYKGKKASEDMGLKSLVGADVSTACIVGKSWSMQVTEVLRTDLDENLAMIAESIEFLKDAGLEVFFDAEHFFDGYTEDPEYSLRCVKAAEAAGADAIVLCDTNGGKLPLEIRKVTKRMVEAVGAPIGIHAHNDSGCGIANSLIAVEAGATQVQGTMNGYGERCGNADLCAIIPSLVLKLGRECVSEEKLASTMELAHFVAEVANIAPDPHQPYVGVSAFAHKGGQHISAISRTAKAYEHVRPELVGNRQRIVVSELSGRSTIEKKAKEMGIDLEAHPDLVGSILKAVKDREQYINSILAKGFHFEAADGSLELLIRRKLHEDAEIVHLDSFRIIVEKNREGRLDTMANVKIWIDNQIISEYAEGNGPVNALDGALRKALLQKYPDLKEIELTDFKVRVLDESTGTGAVTRVLIESTDGEASWGTVGVSENIIEASWQALVDSIEYGLRHSKGGSKPLSTS
ncbi:MAG: citramalate synthase [Chloroflexi bacterium]|nr:citramalate synthase [Chloroflexota bacterium]